jgi:hypothetical protein
MRTFQPNNHFGPLLSAFFPQRCLLANPDYGNVDFADVPLYPQDDADFDDSAQASVSASAWRFTPGGAESQ